LGGWPVGGYSTKGKIPEFYDKRVKIYAGWFQDTLPKLKSDFDATDSVIIINFDADLYSSTLLALSEVNSFGTYFAFFDEFSGDECRALSDYLLAYGANVEFLGKTEWRNYPETVLCKITTKASPHEESDSSTNPSVQRH